MIHDSPSFSSETQQRWAQIPWLTQQRVLTQVWCVACRQSTIMTQVTGTVVGTTLVLRGNCDSCGHAVARVLEDQD